MRPGKELAHPRGLLDFVDFKGSEVRLESVTILEGARQPVPYPAVAWKWTCVQSYAWGQTQHINVLTLWPFLTIWSLSPLEAVCMGPDFFMSWTAECALAQSQKDARAVNC